MPNIIVYSGPNCPYCVRAKALLKKKNVSFDEFDVKADQVKFDEMLAISNGKRTIPQIFIDGVHVGGCDDLYALDAAGKLNPMLGIA